MGEAALVTGLGFSIMSFFYFPAWVTDETSCEDVFSLRRPPIGKNECSQSVEMRSCERSRGFRRILERFRCRQNTYQILCRPTPQVLGGPAAEGAGGRSRRRCSPPLWCPPPSGMVWRGGWAAAQRTGLGWREGSRAAAAGWAEGGARGLREGDHRVLPCRGGITFPLRHVSHPVHLGEDGIVSGREGGALRACRTRFESRVGTVRTQIFPRHPALVGRLVHHALGVLSVHADGALCA